MTVDNVNHPSHYKQGAVECIVAIRAALGKEGFTEYCRGNALKYLWRAGHKGPLLEDLQKAATYIRFAVNSEQCFSPLRDERVEEIEVLREERAVLQRANQDLREQINDLLRGAK